MSHDAPTVSARFIYRSTTTHDGSATIHHGGATNAHDASTIRYGASTIQAGSATVASQPPTNVHDLVVGMWQLAKLWHNIIISSTFDEASHAKKKNFSKIKKSHLTHWLGSVLRFLRWSHGLTHIVRFLLRCRLWRNTACATTMFTCAEYLSSSSCKLAEETSWSGSTLFSMQHVNS